MKRTWDSTSNIFPQTRAPSAIHIIDENRSREVPSMFFSRLEMSTKQQKGGKDAKVSTWPYYVVQSDPETIVIAACSSTDNLHRLQKRVNSAKCIYIIYKRMHLSEDLPTYGRFQ